jgi:hypothetical protein
VRRGSTDRVLGSVSPCRTPSKLDRFLHRIAVRALVESHIDHAKRPVPERDHITRPASSERFAWRRERRPEGRRSAWR